VVEAAEVDWVGASDGVLRVDEVLAVEEEDELAVVFLALLCVVFATVSFLAFAADVFTVVLLAVEVLAVVEAAADRTTCVLPVAISATISAVPAAAAAAVQRVMRLSRRRLAARILVSRVWRSAVMETGDQRDLAKDVEMPVNPLRTRPHVRIERFKDGVAAMPPPVRTRHSPLDRSRRQLQRDRPAERWGRSSRPDPGYPGWLVAPYA
jgi:hypothetical protein